MAAKKKGDRTKERETPARGLREGGRGKRRQAGGIGRTGEGARPGRGDRTERAERGRRTEPGSSPAGPVVYGEGAVIAAALVLSLFWGLAFVWIKVALEDLSPLELTVWRFAFATMMFTPILLWKRRELARISQKDIPSLAVIGFIGMAGYHFLLNWGEQYTYSGTASLVIATAPILVIVASAFLLKEPLTRAKVAGIALALAGVAALSVQGGILRGEGTQTVLGILAVFGAALTAAAFTIGGKRFMARMDPLVFVAMSTIVSLVALLPFFAVSGPTPPGDVSTGTWLAVLALAALCTLVSYGLFFTILRQKEASQTTMYVYLVPVFGVASGALILGESVGPLSLVGGALILAGVWVVNRN